MVEEIYKINHLTVDESKKEFCLSYNEGLMTFDLKNFKEINRSNNFETRLGSISFSQYVPKDNIIIFVGSKYNKEYSEKQIVFFDMDNKKEILSKTFDEEILNIRYVDNLLFICCDKKLNIFSYDKYNDNYELNLKDEINFVEVQGRLFEVWATKNLDNTIDKLYIACQKGKEISISNYLVDDWTLGDIITVKSPVSKIQNLFFIQELNQIFICDEKGIYIYGIDAKDGKVKVCLKRSSNQGVITSMTLLNDNYLAVNNLNKTVHIFDLNIKHNSFSFSNIIYSMTSGLEEIYSCIKIRYKDLLEEKEREYFKKYFEEKGSILVSGEDKEELNIISYCGFAFKIKINFKDAKYKVLTKEKYSDAKNDLQKGDKFKNISLYNCSTVFKKKDNK